MATVHSILTNFTAGELSPRVYGRVDLAKYQNGARELTNMVVVPQGGARKRGGSLNVSNTKDNNPDAILVPFVFSTTQAYMLEFGQYYIRFFKNRGIIYDVQFAITMASNASQCVLTVPGNTFNVGDRVIVTGITGIDELNNREFTVVAKTATTITINVNSIVYAAYGGGGLVSRIYEIATNFTAADIEGMTFTQSADTLFLFTNNWPIQLLKRLGDANWTLTTGNVEEGPFLDMNTDLDNTVSLDVASGGAIMTFSKPFFNAAHVGALFRIWEKPNGGTFGYATWAPGATITVGNNTFWEYKGNVYYVVSGGGAVLASTASYPTHLSGTCDIFYGTGGEIAQMRYEHSGYCIVQITDIVDSQNANATIYYKYRTPYTAYASRSSPQWQEGSWSDLRGYPTGGTFHEQRLVTGNNAYRPTTLWGSMLNAYLNYKDGDKADQAYSYTISSDQVDAIKFMSTTKRLVVNCTSGEYTVAASNQNEAITSTNIKVSRETSFGVANVKPVRAGPAILFAQRTGWNTNPARRLREFVYNFQTDSFVAPDLTILSEHITSPGITQGAYLVTPDLMIWYVRADGDMVAMTYERDQQVVGWHHHIFGGSGFAEHNASIPGIVSDEMWTIIKRVVNGVTIRSIEVHVLGLTEDTVLSDAFYLDNALQYKGPATTVVSGLWHLNGTTVSALADGVPIHDLTVTNGRLFLKTAASTILVGYRYLSRIRTLHIEAGAQGGTAQGQLGRIFEITARLQDSVGGTYGTDLMALNGKLDPIPYRDPNVPLSMAVPLFSGDKRLPFDGEWDRDRYIVIEHDEPLPFTLTALIVGQRVSA